MWFKTWVSYYRCHPLFRHLSWVLLVKGLLLLLLWLLIVSPQKQQPDPVAVMQHLASPSTHDTHHRNASGVTP